MFATGGFTHSARYAREYLNGMYVGGCAARTSEGDIIPIVKALGVPLFHMHSAWGAPVLYEQALEEDAGLIANFTLTGDSVLSVNKHGARVCNEKATYNDRTQSHFAWDPARAEYPNFLQFAILDERTRELLREPGRLDGPPGWQLHPARGRGVEVPDFADTLERLVDAIAARLAALSRGQRRRVGSRRTSSPS